MGNENLLFGLKFTLVGAIMWVLFSLFRDKRSPGTEFERFIQKRRSALFFVAALLCSVIVDTRLRFNAKVIESLGDWVWCMERTKAASVLTWEHFLHLQLDSGGYPILRHFSHFLTALLYAVTLYLFVIIPRTMNRATRTMLWFGGVLFFILLFFVSISHDPLHPFFGKVPHVGDLSNLNRYFGSSLPFVALTTAVTIAGIVCLNRALHVRFDFASAFIRTRDRADLLPERVRFGGIYHQEALIEELHQLASTGKDDEVAKLMECLSSLKSEIIEEVNGAWSFHNIYEIPWHARAWDAARSLFLRNGTKEKAYFKMSRRITRALGRRDSKSNQMDYEADLAEETLWAALFRAEDRKYWAARNSALQEGKSGAPSSAAPARRKPKDLDWVTIEMIIVPKGTPHAAEDVTSAVTFPVVAKGEYDGYVRATNHGDEALTGLVVSFGYETSSMLTGPKPHLRTLPNLISLASRSTRVLGPIEYPLDVDAISPSDQFVAQVSVPTPGQKQLQIGEQKRSKRQEIPYRSLRHRITNVSPAPRKSQVHIFAEWLNDETISLTQPKASSQEEYLEVVAGAHSSNAPKRQHKSSVWMMPGSSGLDIVVDTNFPGEKMETPLVITHLLDGAVASCTRLYISRAAQLAPPNSANELNGLNPHPGDAARKE